METEYLWCIYDNSFIDAPNLINYMDQVKINQYAKVYADYINDAEQYVNNQKKLANITNDCLLPITSTNSI